MIPYSLLSTDVRADEARLLLASWAHSQACPQPGAPLALSVQVSLTTGLSSQAANSSVVREGVCDGVTSKLMSPK